MFGTMVYIIGVIEFQHRRLPHAHIVLRIVLPEGVGTCMQKTAEYVDRFTSAEVPDKTCRNYSICV